MLASEVPRGATIGRQAAGGGAHAWGEFPAQRVVTERRFDTLWWLIRRPQAPPVGSVTGVS